MFVQRSQQHTRRRPLLTAKGNMFTRALRAKHSIAALSAADMKSAVSRFDMSASMCTRAQARRQCSGCTFMSRIILIAAFQANS